MHLWLYSEEFCAWRTEKAFCQHVLGVMIESFCKWGGEDWRLEFISTSIPPFKRVGTYSMLKRSHSLTQLVCIQEPNMAQKVICMGYIQTDMMSFWQDLLPLCMVYYSWIGNIRDIHDDSTWFYKLLCLLKEKSRWYFRGNVWWEWICSLPSFLLDILWNYPQFICG